MRLPLMRRADALDSASLFCLDLVMFLFWILQWPYYVCLSPWPGLPGADSLLCQLCQPPGEKSCLQASAAWGSVCGDGPMCLEVFWSWLWGIGMGKKLSIPYCLPAAPGCFLFLCSSSRKNLSLSWGSCGSLLHRSAAVPGASNLSQMYPTGVGPPKTVFLIQPRKLWCWWPETRLEARHTYLTFTKLHESVQQAK